MTEPTLTRLRRICKIEGVNFYDDAAVIRLCREYLDGDLLLASYQSWRKESWQQAAIDAQAAARHYNHTN